MTRDSSDAYMLILLSDRNKTFCALHGKTLNMFEIPSRSPILIKDSYTFVVVCASPLTPSSGDTSLCPKQVYND